MPMMMPPGAGMPGLPPELAGLFGGGGMPPPNPGMGPMPTGMPLAPGAGPQPMGPGAPGAPYSGAMPPPGASAGQMPLMAGVAQLVQQAGQAPHATPFAQALTELVNSMTKYMKTMADSGQVRARGDMAAPVGGFDRQAGASPMQPGPPALSMMMRAAGVQPPRIA